MSNAKAPWSGTALRRLCRPWVTVVLLFVLWLDACALPRWSMGGVLFSGRWLLRDGRTHCYFPPASWNVVRTPDGLALTNDPWAERVGYAACDVFSSSDMSLWACTRTTRTWQFSAFLNAGVMTPQELAGLRTLAVAQLAAAGDTRLSSEIAAGNGSVTTIHPAAYVHNSVAAAVAVCLLLSLPWIGDVGAGRRRARAIARGVCPRCGYDSIGLARCPECGDSSPRNNAPGSTAPSPS